ncbi:MAG: hypothetical protein MPK62_06495 [Alphaproteobacteria bacterium]|nr:hypothetical protein [Alphaproteobacteria bacterium]
MLLTFGRGGSDPFPVGFYLHNLDSLNGVSEKEKLSRIKKSMIEKLSPNDLFIPEVGGERLELLTKLFQNNIIKNGLGNGWTAERIWGFNITIDANLLKNTGIGWPVFEGKNIHQFLYNYSKPQYVAHSKNGLNRMSKTRVIKGKHIDVHDSYRIIIRNTSSPTNMRTVVASIIPPHSFHTDSVFTLILKQHKKIILNRDYLYKLTYLCGIFNSMTFDYMARSIVQMNVKTAILSLPIPNESMHNKKISQLSAMLSIGTNKFASLAESMRLDNLLLTSNQRIKTTAMLDALVAHAYGLSKFDYQVVLNSFKFGEDPTLMIKQNINWSDGNTMKNFYGEVRKLAPKYYNDIGDGKID